MNNCENLNILELVEKAKQLESVNTYLRDIFLTLREYYENKSNYGDESIEAIKQFDALNLNDRFLKVKYMIKAGNAESILERIQKEKEQLSYDRKNQEVEFQYREKELLNAWNNFQNWKSQTSANLIKDLNSKFKENV